MHELITEAYVTGKICEDKKRKRWKKNERRDWKGEGLDGGVIFQIMHFADGDGGTHDGASCI